MCLDKMLKQGDLIIIDKLYEKLVQQKHITAPQSFSLKKNPSNNRLELHQWSKDGSKKTCVWIKYYYLDHNWTIFCIDEKGNKYALLLHIHRSNPNLQEFLQDRSDIIYLLDTYAILIARLSK